MFPTQDVHLLNGGQLALAVSEAATAAAAPCSARRSHGIHVSNSSQRLQIVLPFDPLLCIVRP
jgi:hypothetical protein